MSSAILIPSSQGLRPLAEYNYADEDLLLPMDTIDDDVLHRGRGHAS
jgi:hypothetical protein